MAHQTYCPAGRPSPADRCDPARRTCRCPYAHPLVATLLDLVLSLVSPGACVPPALTRLADWAYGLPCWLGLPETDRPAYWRLPPLDPPTRIERRIYRRARRAERRAVRFYAAHHRPRPSTPVHLR